MSYEPRPCTSCGGSKGRTETTSNGSKTVQVWRPCSGCGGKGVR